MIVEAFLFGLTLALAIGPIALLILNTGLRFGMLTGLRSALGAAVGDLFYAAIALCAGAALAPVLDVHRTLFQPAASLLLLGIGLRMLISALQPPQDGQPGIVGKVGRPFLTTFGLTIVNPLTILAFAGFAARSGRHLDPASIIIYTLALFAGSLSVQVFLALGGAALGTLLRQPVCLRMLNIASASGVIVFGVTGLVLI